MFHNYRTLGFGIVLLASASYFLLAQLPVNPVKAQTLTNDVTCERAKRMFERTGRVYTRTRLGSILPIYGGVPIRFKHRLICGHYVTPSVKKVITLDRRSCPISAKCPY